MTTTTIRLEGDLKARVAAAALQAGTTTHSFILDAIAKTVTMVELDNEFNTLADRRWENLLKTGKTVSWSDTQAYLLARSRGDAIKRPVARKMQPPQGSAA